MDLVRKSFTSRDQLAFQDTSFMANSCLGEVPGCVSVSAELLQLSAEGAVRHAGSRNGAWGSLTGPQDLKEEPSEP